MSKCPRSKYTGIFFFSASGGRALACSNKHLNFHTWVSLEGRFRRAGYTRVMPTPFVSLHLQLQLSKYFTKPSNITMCKQT